MSLTPKTPIPEGAIRYNTDSNKMEVWIGDKWMIVATSSPNLGDSQSVASGRGLVAGGNPGTNQIEYITIASMGDAINFGDLQNAAVLNASGGSHIRALHTIGTTSHNDSIEFTTISTLGDSTDFGDITQNRRNTACGGNRTRMLICGGVFGSNPYSYKDEIEFVTISQLGDTIDFGDMQEGRTGVAIASTQTRVYMMGGYDSSSPNATNHIEYVTIGSTGNSIDFGDLRRPNNGSGSASCSNGTRGFVFGGRDDAGTTHNDIEKVELSTRGNSTRFGDLTQTLRFGSGTSDKTRGVRIAGYISPADTENMDHITMSTEGNAIDFGDLGRATRSLGTSTSNAHGGL